jgi:diguanylate cyclase (GGDEF)-like protein/PAS domain S-box-containing protein
MRSGEMMASNPSQAETAEPRAPASVAPGVAVVGSDGIIRFANPEFLAILGRPLAQVAGQSLSLLFEGQADSACLAGLCHAIDEAHEFAHHLRARRPDGRPFSADLSVVPVRKPDDEPPDFIAVLRDTSTASHVEEALEAGKLHFRNLLDHLPAGVVVRDTNGRIVAANDLAARLLGRSIEQLMGTGLEAGWRFVNHDGKPMRTDEFPTSRSLATRTNMSNIVVGFDHGAGHELVWALCNTYLVCDELGEVSQVVVCFTDCTELKRAEQSLQKSEERLRLILQGSNDAPWDWDMRTNELYYPPRWWQMIGRADNELPADPWLWLRLTHPEDQQRVLKTFEHALAGTAETFEVELRLQHKDGHYVPVLSRAHIVRDEQGAAVRVSGTNTDLTERKEAERRIHQLAFFDYLTDLPNRRFLMDQLHMLLSRCVRNGCIGALLFIDLDNFKLLNDTLGHDVGDLLLRQVGYRLRHAVRETDHVARLGGDEFVIVLDDLGADLDRAAAEADAVGHKLLAVCAENYALPSRAYHSTTSIGVALFDAHTESVDELLKQADLAMYQAKAAGRNTLRFFDPLMQAAIDRRYALEHDLREGLLRNEFRLYCQPQFDGDGRLRGGEILLRWEHPERGLVMPGEFIGMLEATGLMLPLGRWVLRESCLRLAAWAADPVLGQVALAVNVSAQQLHLPDFAAQVLAILADAGADPHRLSLELTESLLAENIEEVIDKMNRLKSAGVKFSIDDFGTGYSSLSYLKRFPLGTLKIDQSFVHDIHTDPAAAAIVEVIITLARKLGLKVIAEGVEEEGQREFLRKGGCDGFQGYLQGRPVSIDEFERRYGAP